MIRGGYQYNGEPISKLDREEIRRVIEDIKQKDISAVAITGVFSRQSIIPSSTLWRNATDTD